MEEFQQMERQDILTTDLCAEIDRLNDDVRYWKALYKQEVQERNAELTDNLEYAKRGVGQALLFALAVREGEDGSLVIDKDSRESLAESFSIPCQVTQIPK